MNDSLLNELRDLASEKTAYEKEDFNPNDNFGGNMDDAYWGGIDDGKILLAREIIESLNK